MACNFYDKMSVNFTVSFHCCECAVMFGASPLTTSASQSDRPQELTSLAFRSSVYLPITDYNEMGEILNWLPTSGLTFPWRSL
jgi:hypothetical protein